MASITMHAGKAVMHTSRLCRGTQGGGACTRQVGSMQQSGAYLHKGMPASARCLAGASLVMYAGCHQGLCALHHALHTEGACSEQQELINNKT